jgi:hypothetical protein
MDLQSHLKSLQESKEGGNVQVGVANLDLLRCEV